MTLPPRILPGRCSRMMLRAVTDLPHPDSPTMPSVSPGRSSKLMPSTALTMPSFVVKTVRRSWTSRRGCVKSELRLETRVECVPNGVAEDIRCEHRDKDRDAGPDHQPEGVEEVALRVGQHVAPAWCRRLDAEAEEVEGGLITVSLSDARVGRPD